MRQKWFKALITVLLLNFSFSSVAYMSEDLGQPGSSNQARNSNYAESSNQVDYTESQMSDKVKKLVKYANTNDTIVDFAKKEGISTERMLDIIKEYKDKKLSIKVPALDKKLRQNILTRRILEEFAQDPNEVEKKLKVNKERINQAVQQYSEGRLEYKIGGLNYKIKEIQIAQNFLNEKMRSNLSTAQIAQNFGMSLNEGENIVNSYRKGMIYFLDQSFPQNYKAKQWLSEYVNQKVTVAEYAQKNNRSITEFVKMYKNYQEGKYNFKIPALDNRVSLYEEARAFLQKKGDTKLSNKKLAPQFNFSVEDAEKIINTYKNGEFHYYDLETSKRIPYRFESFDNYLKETEKYEKWLTEFAKQKITTQELSKKMNIPLPELQQSLLNYNSQAFDFKIPALDGYLARLDVYAKSITKSIPRIESMRGRFGIPAEAIIEWGKLTKNPEFLTGYATMNHTVTKTVQPPPKKLFAVSYSSGKGKLPEASGLNLENTENVKRGLSSYTSSPSKKGKLSETHNLKNPHIAQQHQGTSSKKSFSFPDNQFKYMRK